MAALGSLEQIFEKPLPENPTLLESLSPCKRWIRSMKPIVEDSSATEIFGELHFKEPAIRAVAVDPPSSSPSPTSSCSSSLSSSIGKSLDKSSSYGRRSSHYKNGDSFSSDGGLSLCTEGLGSESVDEVENLLTNEQSACNNNGDGERRYCYQQKKIRRCRRSSSSNNDGSCEEETHHLCNESKISISNRSSGGFPPPLSSIGRSGKPWICLKSYREDGRFILKEIKIPTQEFLHYCRENGRLTVQFMQSDDEDEDDRRENGGIDADKCDQ